MGRIQNASFLARLPDWGARPCSKFLALLALCRASRRLSGHGLRSRLVPVFSKWQFCLSGVTYYPYLPSELTLSTIIIVLMCMPPSERRFSDIKFRVWVVLLVFCVIVLLCLVQIVIFYYGCAIVVVLCCECCVVCVTLLIVYCVCDLYFGVLLCMLVCMLCVCVAWFMFLFLKSRKII